MTSPVKEEREGHRPEEPSLVDWFKGNLIDLRAAFEDVLDQPHCCDGNSGPPTYCGCQGETYGDLLDHFEHAFLARAAAPESCPECGVDLKEGDLFTGACELCSASSPVVDRAALVEQMAKAIDPTAWKAEAFGNEALQRDHQARARKKAQAALAVIDEKGDTDA